MTNTRDIIIELKAVRDEKDLSYTGIRRKLEEKGLYPISKSTIARVFSDGSEDLHFDYERTIRPIANALLDMETIEETDDIDTKGMKSIIKYKGDRIKELTEQVKELKTALDKEKIKYHEKLDREREQHQKSIDFLKHQIELKDKRIDCLMEKENKIFDMILNCPARNGGKCE